MFCTNENFQSISFTQPDTKKHKRVNELTVNKNQIQTNKYLINTSDFIDCGVIVR